ncbi:hypothetical protein ACP70R_023399 [Stipagrostis hirtigluma subsp. patula]
MLREVLLRLPARPLCRLRAVSRAWRSLISDPAFVAAHASRHPGPLVAVGVIAGKFGGMVELVMMDMSGNIRKRVPAGGWRPEAKMLTHGHLAAMALDGRCIRVRVVDMESGAVSLVPDRIQVEHASDGGRTCPWPRLRGAQADPHQQQRPRPGLPCRHHRRRRRQRRQRQRLDGEAAPPGPVFPGHGRAVVVNGIAYFLVRPQWSPTILRGPVSSCTDDTAEHTAGCEWHFQLTALNGRLVVVHRNVDQCSMDLWFRTGCSSDEGRAPWHRRYVIRYESKEAMHLAGAVEPLWELDDGRLAVWCLFSGEYGRLHKVLRTYDPSTNAFADVKEMEECVGVDRCVHRRHLVKLLISTFK